MSKNIIKQTRRGATIVTEEAQREKESDQRAAGLTAEQDQGSAQNAIARTLAKAEARKAKNWAGVSIVAAVVSALAAAFQLFK